MNREITLTVNGEVYTAPCAENATLLTFLREQLHLTGTKEGCGAGECGACTVIMNGKAVNSCCVMAFEAMGADISTIEGESKGGKLSKLQMEFIEKQAIQCGFCTPGMIMAAKALLDENPNPTREEIIEGMSGNFCRCNGYEQIIEAVEAAAGGEKND